MKIYKRLFSYIPEKKNDLIFSFIFSLISIFLCNYGFYNVWKALDFVFIKKDLLQALNSAGIVVISFLGYLVIYLLGVWMSHRAAFRLESNLRKTGVKHLLKASNTFYDLNQSGKIRKIIDDNAAQTHMIVAHLIPDQTVAFLSPILMLLLIFFVDIKLGFIFILILAFSGNLFSKMMGNGNFMELYMNSLESMNAAAVEYIRGMPVVKIFATPLVGFKSLYEAIMNYSKLAYKYAKSCKNTYVTFQWGLNLFIIIPVLFYGFIPEGNVDIWIAKSLFFAIFIGLLFSNMMRIMYAATYSYQAEVVLNKLEEIFSEMEKDKINFGKNDKFDNYDIEFENVNFSYDKDKKVLEDFSMKLKEGKTYALVGSSGGGKSTIAKLISGLYPIESGIIKIGDKDIYSYSLNALMNNIGFVFQKPNLFKGSIYENVKIGKKHATKEEVFEALKMARCDDIIGKFKDGVNTIIGSEGVHLSGGEKQRLSIARVFLKNPKILILDEASAAADPENEYEIQKAFSNLMKGKTVIMIAHRLSSIVGCDEILVIDDGKVIERGNHKELLEKDGIYKKLQDLYNTSNNWRIS